MKRNEQLLASILVVAVLGWIGYSLWQVMTTGETPTVARPARERLFDVSALRNPVFTARIFPATEIIVPTLNKNFNPFLLSYPLKTAAAEATDTPREAAH